MSYMYATPTKEECVNGENWWYEKSIEAEVWYTMYMYIKLNTPGAHCSCSSMPALCKMQLR